jgi:beta-1,2-mannobiose phosphorylase / 1,2-beta-oligomannan phosphorylase
VIFGGELFVKEIMVQNETLFNRHPANPILTAKDWPYPINSVFNAGATLLADGTTLLLCRVEDRRGLSHLCAARSRNGVDGWEIDSTPTLLPDPDRYPEELWGIEDPRITYVPELKQYAVAFTSYSRGGPGVSLALTDDFRSYERLGVIMTPDDKDAALLPRRINGYWALIHRPMTPLGTHIWISYSPDLRHWGNHKLMLGARRGAWWDANRIGMSPPPIETPRGWLMIYHGVRRTPSSSIYRLGLALFDLEQPDICLIRGDSWMFAPEADYERQGDVQDVVFPCGYTIAADGDTIRLYYGAADSSIALASGSLRGLLEWLDENGHSEQSHDRRHRPT